MSQPVIANPIPFTQGACTNFTQALEGTNCSMSGVYSTCTINLSQLDPRQYSYLYQSITGMVVNSDNRISFLWLFGRSGCKRPPGNTQTSVFSILRPKAHPRLSWNTWYMWLSVVASTHSPTWGAKTLSLESPRDFLAKSTRWVVASFVPWTTIYWQRMRQDLPSICVA